MKKKAVLYYSRMRIPKGALVSANEKAVVTANGNYVIPTKGQKDA